MMTIDERLTGSTRYRVGFFGKVILQVEVSFLYIDRCTRDTYWRDAKITDVTTRRLV